MPLPTAFQVALVEALGRDWAELSRPLEEAEVEVSYAGSQLLEREVYRMIQSGVLAAPRLATTGSSRLKLKASGCPPYS